MWRRTRSVRRGGFAADALDGRSGGISHRIVCSVVAAQADPNALWNIVHGQCVPDERQHGDPKPCAEVELGSGLAGGYAVLKDIRGATQYLLIPTRQIGGIESRALLEPHAANYFADCLAGAAPGRQGAQALDAPRHAQLGH